MLLHTVQEIGGGKNRRKSHPYFRVVTVNTLIQSLSEAQGPQSSGSKSAENVEQPTKSARQHKN